jgi:DNA-binding transcriptional LysR family regulator
MEFRQLECFCKVAELGSFTLAAESLFLSQPTVSAHVQMLEKILGKRLFDRIGKRVVLTPEGELFYQYARQILLLKEKAKKAIEGKNLSGELEIYASTLPGEYLIPQVLGELLAEAPEAKIKVHIYDSYKVISAVERNQVELGLVGMKKESEKLVFQPFFRDKVILIVPRGHPFFERTISLEELLGEKLILRELGSGTRKAFEEKLKKCGFSLSNLKLNLLLGSTTAVKEAVRAGLGIGVISNIAVKEELGRDFGEVRIRELDPIERAFYLVTRKGRTLTPLGRRLIEILLNGRWKGETI